MIFWFGWRGGRLGGSGGRLLRGLGLVVGEDVGAVGERHEKGREVG